MLLWLSHLLMDFFTGIWPIYKTIAQIDLVKAGLIAGISGFIGEMFQVVFGYLCDRGWRKKILFMGLALASSIIWVTFVEGIFNSFLLLLLLMLGSGSFHPAAAGMASCLSKESKGKTILIFASGGAVGLGISQLAFTYVMNFFNGHALVLLIPVAITLLLIALHRFPAQEIPPASLSLRGFFNPIMHCKKPLILLYLSQVATQGLALAFMFLLPDLLRARECHEWLCMGGGHLCFVVGSALTMIPAGYLSDRHGQKSVLLVVLTGAFSLFYLFLGQDELNTIGTMILLASLGAFLGIINPIIVSWGNRLVPESPSTVSALLMGFAWCFSSFGPTSVSLIAQRYSLNPFANAIATMGLLLVVIFFLILLMPKPGLAKAPVAEGLNPQGDTVSPE